MKELRSQILVNQIENNKLYHAYVFEGLDQDLIEGQYQAFARRVLAQTRDLEKKFDSGNLADFKVIEAEKNIITIDQIRALNAKIFEKPLECERKIFVIKNAHDMRQEAQNALLKTLEEPPSYSVIILTTDNRSKLRDTILSRCQIIAYQAEKKVDLSQKDQDQLVDLMAEAKEGNRIRILKSKEVFEAIEVEKKEIISFYLDLITQIALYKKDFIREDRKTCQRLGEFSGFSDAKLEALIFKLEEVNRLLAVNINFQIAMEDFLFSVMKED